MVRGVSVPISTKDSIAICKFIKKKKIEKAINDLEQVLIHKQAIPMKGEIPHRKGRGMMSGRYSKKAAESFIRLLKSLKANAQELNEPVIAEAIANIASRPYGRFGNIRRKRTHIKIVAKEKKALNKK
ncbi:MAG: uL22 family ribosomal protein [Nanoarchaeota archaeon]